jgi:para-aminobenzoate synthetase
VSERRRQPSLSGRRSRRVALRRLSWLCSPEQAFESLCRGGRHCYWLDSALEQPEQGRWSFLGGDGIGAWESISYSLPRGVVTRVANGRRARRRAQILPYLRAELEPLSGSNDSGVPFAAGFVGYLGYELKADLGARLAHRLPYPEACFILARAGIAFDHQERAIYLTELVEGRHDPSWMDETARRLCRAGKSPPLAAERAAEVSRFRSSLTPGEYGKAFDACQESLRDGDSYEICLTMQLRAQARLSALGLYKTLRRTNPAPQAAFLRLGDLAVLSSSPERFLSVGRDGIVESRPIKGTAPRDSDPRRDAALAKALRSDEKTRAENLTIVDLVRNDLAHVCRAGSVRVPEPLAIESYANVHQLVSTVRGELRDDADALDAVAAAFPGGSMTGAPKLRTMEIIDRLEPCARGVYSGCLGYLDVGGGADLSIVIRTLVQQRGTLSLGTGGAITVDSEPDEEYAEAMLKARPLLEAVASSSKLDIAELWP